MSESSLEGVREDLGLPSPYGRLMGTRFMGWDDATRVLELEYLALPEFTNRLGTVAGGMVSSFLDSVTGLAAHAALPVGLFAVHTSLEVRFRRPVPQGRVRARARVLEVSERDVRAQGELIGEDGETLATAEATLRVVRRRPPASEASDAESSVG